MKPVDNSQFADILFEDVVMRLNESHTHNDGKCFTGNIRMNLGLYRTPVEADRYISESLKRKLP